MTIYNLMNMIILAVSLTLKLLSITSTCQL